MRLTFIDLMIPVVLASISGIIAGIFPRYLPVIVFMWVPVYIAFAAFVYRKFGLPPMLLPRCACCGRRTEGFQVLLGNWPRITFRCPKCDGEFVVWHDGKVGSDETWEKPVLVLKWPYVFGPYRKMEKPKASD